MINCNEINQVANEVLATLRKCKPVTNDVVIKLTELIMAINNCNEGSRGLSALIPNWENRLYLQELLVFHNNSIWRNDCEEVTGEPGIDECWTLLAEINQELLWENISGDQDSVNISGFNNDSEFITLQDIPPQYFEDDITVSLSDGKTIGKYVNGDTIPAQGKTFEEVLNDIAFEVQFPVLTPYSISGSAGSAVEVGTGTKTITVNFTRGNIVGDLDSGVWNPTLVQGQILGTANKYWINDIDNGTSNSTTISEITTLGTNSVNIAVDYDAGAQPKDSKGDNYLTPEPAGTLNGVATWSGFYYRTAIAGNSVPTASDIRTSYTARRSNAGVINMSTGTTNVRFDVFVPQGSSLTSAIDEGNLDLNITAEFILQGSNFSGLDANGDEVLYKHYVRIVDNPYNVSSNIAITVT